MNETNPPQLAETDVADQTKKWAESRHLKWWHHTVTDSTNKAAKDEAFTVKSPVKVYVTDEQTSGRGRQQNTWLNATKGTCLLSSWSMTVPSPPQHLTGPVFGLALFEAVQSTWPQLEWSLKAPNDLYLKDKKIAGLLCEVVSEGQTYQLVIGLGFNVYDHPRSLDHATHLTSEYGTGGPVTLGKWEQFLDHLYTHLREAKDQCLKQSLDSDSRERLLRALNAYPKKEDIYIDVGDTGDLVTSSGTIAWHEL